MERRRFLAGTVGAWLAPSFPATAATSGGESPSNASPNVTDAPPASKTTLFLAGDAMTGRGVDQILPHPGNPRLFEEYAVSARRYVELAEAASGPIARPAGFDYVWGDALAELESRRPDARIVNLETAVTTSDDAALPKAVLYRMHPANVGCLSAARIDCCTLANNHVLDWGRRGLAETLATLRAAGIRTTGAGADEDEARAPALIDVAGGRRIVVLSFGLASAGVPAEWAATRSRGGVWLLPALDARAVDAIAARVSAIRRAGDVVVASIHWGSNWGYPVPSSHRTFAQRLVDRAGVDVVHGHSSHHPRGIEIYRDRPILYGCGDLLNDYEGIGGYEAFRPELGVIVFATLGAGGTLVELTLVPTRIARLRVNRARGDDVAWLAATLDRESREFGARVERRTDDTLRVAPR